MQKQFYRTLSIRGTNFCACSASGKMWTVFICKSMLSIRIRILSHTGHMLNEFYRWLSIYGMDFIAGWAYEEMFKSEYLGRIKYDFQKSRVTGPKDHKVSVSAKKCKKKISCLCNILIFAGACLHLHAKLAQILWIFSCYSEFLISAYLFFSLSK